MTADRRRIPMKPINEMKVTFPSRSANEGFARAVVASFLSQLDPAVDELSDLRTAVSEAVTNCIVHAYPDSIGDITVQMRLFENGRTVVKVRDRGCGIEDVEQAMEPMFTTCPEDGRSGMGFSFMEAFMDQVEVVSAPGKGTSVTMKKKIGR